MDVSGTGWRSGAQQPMEGLLEAFTRYQTGHVCRDSMRWRCCGARMMLRLTTSGLHSRNFQYYCGAMLWLPNENDEIGSHLAVFRNLPSLNIFMATQFWNFCQTTVVRTRRAQLSESFLLDTTISNCVLAAGLWSKSPLSSAGTSCPFKRYNISTIGCFQKKQPIYHLKKSKPGMFKEFIKIFVLSKPENTSENVHKITIYARNWKIHFHIWQRFNLSILWRIFHLKGVK